MIIKRQTKTNLIAEKNHTPIGKGADPNVSPEKYARKRKRE